MGKATEVIKMPSANLFLVDGQEVNEQIVIAKKKEYLKLEIKDAKDKHGYEAVVKAIADLRTTRTTLDKVRKEGDEPIRNLLDLRKKNADKLIELLKDGQNQLEARKDFIDKIKEEEKEAKRLAYEKIIQDRKEQILALGYTYLPEAQVFSLPDGSRVANMLQIESFEDDQFADLLISLGDSAEDFNTRKKEAERLDKRTADRAKQANDIMRVNGLPLGGLISREEYDSNAETMDNEDWNNYFESVKNLVEIEREEVNKQVLRNQVITARENNIENLYLIYQLPLGFLGDTSEITTLDDDKNFEEQFNNLITKARADKKRRDDEAEELELLRKLKDSLEVPAIEEAPEKVAHSFPISTSPPIEEEEPNHTEQEFVAPPSPVKISKPVINFLKEQGMLVNMPLHGNFAFLPFWFELVDDIKGLVIMHPLGKLPIELREFLESKRESEIK